LRASLRLRVKLALAVVKARAAARTVVADLLAAAAEVEDAEAVPTAAVVV